MQYTAALIEYTITGLVSLIWIALLVSAGFDIRHLEYDKVKDFIIIGIIPVAYISGIFIDVTSSYVLKQLACIWTFANKRVLNKILNKKVKSYVKKILIGCLNSEAYGKSAEILSFSTSDTIRTMETYVSRDRIARGMFLNSLTIGIVLTLTTYGDGKQNLIITSFIIAFISIFIRIRLFNLSRVYKEKALKSLKERASLTTK